MSSYVTVEKALHLLELIADRGPLGVSDLARQMKMEKSGVSRLLKTLTKLGFTLRLEDRGRFQLGPRLLYLGNAYLRGNVLVREAQPIMDDLALQIRASIHLAAQVGGQFIILAKSASPERIQVDSAVGSAVIPHASALGKVLLAHQTREERELFLRHPLTSYTRGTIVTRSALERELASVVHHGYALERGEEHAGVGCIGVPVRDGADCTVAALSASGPLQGTPFKLGRREIEMMLNATHRLSMLLGFGNSAQPRKQATLERIGA